MTVYTLKEWKNGTKRRAYVSARCEYRCPEDDPHGYSDKHTPPRQAGDFQRITLSHGVEVLSDEGGYTTEKITTVVRLGKVGDGHLPICRCGSTFARKGYRFRLTDEDHSTKAIILAGFARNGCGDREIEDRYFSTKKAAIKHLNALYSKLAPSK